MGFPGEGRGLMETGIGRGFGRLGFIVWVGVFKGMGLVKGREHDFGGEITMRIFKKNWESIYRGGIRGKERYFGDFKLNLLILGTVFCLEAWFSKFFAIFNYTRGLFGHCFNLLKTPPFFFK